MPPVPGPPFRLRWRCAEAAERINETQQEIPLQDIRLQILDVGFGDGSADAIVLSQ